ncbi:MAG: serine protease, partial [Candidatus Omnitrophica bacterium]|nr:serine protease [Candidatus Omnitrophota bacterium]
MLNDPDNKFMSYLLNILLTFVLLYAGGHTPLAMAEPNAIDTLEKAKESMVTVKGLQFMIPPESEQATATKVAIYEQTGAGVIIDPKGIIVTNTHIIYGSQRIMVSLKDGREWGASVLYISPLYDFSLLKINADVPLKA